MKSSDSGTCQSAAVAFISLLLALPSLLSVRVHHDTSGAVMPPVGVGGSEDAEHAALLSATWLDTARCKATCLQELAESSAAGHFTDCHMSQECDMCWQTCGLIQANFPVWGNVCQAQDVCFTGCQAACAFHHNISEATSLTQGKFHKPPRLEPVGNHFRVTWTLPEATQGDISPVPLVYTVLEKQPNIGMEWQRIGQSQGFSAMVSRLSTTKPWELRVVAVTTRGIWAASAVALVPSSKAASYHEPTDKAESLGLAAEPRVLRPWRPPELLSLHPSTTKGLEAHVSWQPHQDLLADMGEKYEVTWTLTNAAIELTGLLYTSKSEARFPVLQGYTYSVSVRQLGATGRSVAASEVLFLESSATDTEATLLHNATGRCFRVEMMAACLSTTAVLAVLCVASTFCRKCRHSVPLHSHTALKGASTSPILKEKQNDPACFPEERKYLPCDQPSSCQQACGYQQKITDIHVALKDPASPADGTYFVFDLR
ncbi:uncharacterized protein LOC142765206 [Rhipicephalus microplus]|uniref:uncharacterized protein LOC142765206 n=1 Tax=Rhipicephalus microplus TaxID=6941 RepID=UPI003F6D67D7